MTAGHASPGANATAGGLRVDGLHLRYGEGSETVLRGVDFAVPAGTLTALLGPSGCGKTSVLRAIAGLAEPSSGAVRIDGRDLADLSPDRRRMGYLFQEGGLFPHLTVGENVLFPLRARHEPPDAAERKAGEALDAVGMRYAVERRPQTLSGGEQQRVALARALAQAPAVLLLDEPLARVEPRLRRALREQIRALQQQRVLTVVYVTHDQHEALAVSDQVVLMDRGRVVEAGPPHRLYEAPATAFAAAFMGDASVLRGERHADGTVCIGPLMLPQAYPGVAGPVQVAVRPEAWRLRPCNVPGLPGRVMQRRYLGRVTEYQLMTPAGNVIAHGSPVQWLDPGAPVSLSLARQGAWVMPAT